MKTITPPYLIESKSKLHSYITLTETLTVTARLPYLWKGDSVVIGKRTIWGSRGRSGLTGAAKQEVTGMPGQLLTVRLQASQVDTCNRFVR